MLYQPSYQMVLKAQWCSSDTSSEWLTASQPEFLLLHWTLAYNSHYTTLLPAVLWRHKATAPKRKNPHKSYNLFENHGIVWLLRRSKQHLLRLTRFLRITQTEEAFDKMPRMCTRGVCSRYFTYWLLGLSRTGRRVGRTWATHTSEWLLTKLQSVLVP